MSHYRYVSVPVSWQCPPDNGVHIEKGVVSPPGRGLVEGGHVPYVLEYLDSLELGNSREKQLAWLQLSEEQDDQQQWEKNISLLQEKQRISSRSFYNSQPVVRLDVQPSSSKLGNIMDFLHSLSTHLPALEQLVVEYRQKAVGVESSRRGRGET